MSIFFCIDGNGHTLTVNYSDQRTGSDDNYCAPFRYIKNATIRNLHVTGDIYKDHAKYVGGLVGKAQGTNYITNCRSSVDIDFEKSGDVSSGGFIGELRESGSTTFTNCLFDGKLRGEGATSWGGFVGWVASGRTATFVNCLFNPAESNSDGKTFARKASDDGHVTVSNCYYTASIGGDVQGATDASEMANNVLKGNLGNGWKIVTESEVGKVVPIMATTIISLANNANNSSVIDEYAGQTIDVALTNRTLFKDGKWNTLCLPFGLNSFTGTPLEGATVMTLGNSAGCNTGYDAETGTLTLDFVDAYAIEAGVAYIVMWNKPDGYDDHESDFDISDPLFTGVKISNEDPDDQKTVSQDCYVQFIGTYSPADIYTADKTNLYLGDDNSLYYPWGEDMTSFYVNSCRAYFQLLNGLTADKSQGVRAFKLNFGDENIQGIIDVEADSSRFTHHSPLSEWYTLDGRKLDSKPTKKGVYINNGIKVTIK